MTAANYYRPVVGTDGTIYVGCTDGNVYAIGSNGVQIWSYKESSGIYYSLTERDGILYFLCDDGFLNVVTANSGELLWKYQFNGIESPAVGDDGTIYVVANATVSPSALCAISSTATLKWCVHMGLPESSPKIGTDGTIYVGSDDYNLYAISPDGVVKWTFRTGFWLKATPAIGADGTIYVGSYDHYLYAITPEGSLKCTYWVGISSEYAAIGADGTVYFKSYGTYVYAISPDGQLKWTYPTSDYWGSPVVGPDGRIYAESKNSLIVLSPDGSLIWMSSFGGGVSVVVRNVYVASGSVLHALNETEGKSKLKHYSLNETLL